MLPKYFVHSSVSHSLDLLDNVLHDCLFHTTGYVKEHMLELQKV